MQALKSKRVPVISIKEFEMYSHAVEEIDIFRGEEAVGSDSISEIGGRVSAVVRKAAGLTWKAMRFVNPFSLTDLATLGQSLTISQVPFAEHETREERVRREKIDIVMGRQFFRPE